MTPAHVYKFKKAIAILLIVFGTVLFFKNYIPENQLKKIERHIESPIKKYQNNTHT